LVGQVVEAPFDRGSDEITMIHGAVELTAASVSPGGYRLTLRILNLTPSQSGESSDPDRLLSVSMASTHAILGVRHGEFVPLRDPPPSLRDAAEECRSVGLWPMLVGEPGARDLLLCAPIILDDYPQVAPESPGDLFDSTEIDEILSLRILTLTLDEKREMAAGDERVRALLARTESLDTDELARLHGAVRTAMSTVKTPQTLRIGGREAGPGDKVRLHPRGRSDIFDVALAGQIATIVSVEQDYDARTYLAVTVDDDPGRDLGAEGNTGHRFFFAPEEVEPLVPPEHPG
jgi:hypothetical protein